MRWKRLFYYLILNILISACTILAVLTIWDQFKEAETIATEPLILPTSQPTVEVTPTLKPEPTAKLQTYRVGAGETLGEIALLFNISVDELMELNGLSDPDALSEGMILFVPDDSPLPETATATGTPEVQPTLEATPTLDGQAQIEIVAVVGAGDLNTERVQFRGTGTGSLTLTGWQLRDEDGNVFTFPQMNLYDGGALDVYSRAGVNTVVALYWGRSEPVWRSGEIVTLIDAEGRAQALFQVP